MKKILLIAIAALFAACSSDDNGGSVNEGSVEVLGYSSEADQVLGGYVYRYTVTLKNTYDELKSGDVVFKYQSGNLVRYDYVNDISIGAGQTQTFTGDWNNTVHQTDNETASEIYFVE